MEVLLEDRCGPIEKVEAHILAGNPPFAVLPWDGEDFEIRLVVAPSAAVHCAVEVRGLAEVAHRVHSHFFGSFAHKRHIVLSERYRSLVGRVRELRRHRFYHQSILPLQISRVFCSFDYQVSLQLTQSV